MKNRLLVGLAIFSMTLFAAAKAQGQQVEPGVARISLTHGDVSTQRGDSGDWVVGRMNTPVVAGDRVATGTRSRAELQLDYANILRLDERSEAKIADLARTHIQVQVSKGIVNYTVFKGNEADAEIDTPNVAVRPLGEGRYRVQVTDDKTEVIVREGEADVSTPQGSTRVRKGQLITVRGRDNPEYQVSDAPRHDSWDDWNKNRDHQIQDAQSWGHTNRYYTGVNDLDPYGRWVYVPGYDYCWAPVAPVGWAPYSYGRWVWEPYWGWTWVSYEPWGWAPYHYGRWFLYGGGWYWWPGPVYPAYQPWWAPAYVSFFGFGRHFGVGVGFGFGSIGWLPIGPSDFFFPWWGGFGRRVNVVNVTNITNITNITHITNVSGVRPVAPLAVGNRPVFSNVRGVLTNRRLQQGVTAMSAEQFGRMAVPSNFQHLSAADLRQGQMVAGIVPVVPTRESLRSVDRAVNSAALPTHSNQPEHFFTKSTPTVTPQPFHAQAAQVQQTLQQHQPAASENRAAPSTPSRTEAAGRTAVTTATPGSPSRPAVSPTAPAASQVRPASPAVTPQSREEGAGWQRFGGERAAPAEQPSTPARPARLPDGQAGAPQRAQAEPPARNNVQPAPSSSGGWQKFSSAPSTPSGAVGQPTPREMPNQQPAAREKGRGTVSPSQAAPPERPGWQGFTRQPPAAGPPSSQQPRQAPESVGPRSFSRGGQFESPRGDNRPALNLHRPIVTPRSSSGPSGGYGGGRGPSGGPPAGRAGNGGHGSSRPSSGSSDQGHHR